MRDRASATRARPNWLALAAALYGASVCLHRAGNELADRLRFWLGDLAWTSVCVGIGLAGALSTLSYAWHLANRVADPVTWKYRIVTLTLISVVGTARWLTVAVEWVHLVQYALLIVLIERGLPPKPLTWPSLGTPSSASRVWSGDIRRVVWLVGIGVLLGALDEAVQWAVLYRERTDLSLDVRDVGLDLLGVLWGVTLTRLWRERRASARSGPSS